MLEGRTVVLGVTGGIAAYKTAYLASALRKQHANVHVVMTEHATQFISPLTFETLTNNRCTVEMFDRHFEYDVKHISLAKAADLMIVAPATANFIAKAANGIADDMLTTVFLAARCPKLVVPAMNTAMYENPATLRNMQRLADDGIRVIEPAEGLLACGDEGKGKMPEPDVLLEHILNEIAFDHDLEGLKVLVTAGPTQESIDPVRYITNHSSGKMGYAIAKVCRMRGADVTLVSGPVALAAPLGVKVVNVLSAADMHDLVMENSDADMVFMAAAVADYTPVTTADHKIKKKDGDMSIPLKRTLDILGDLAKVRTDRQVVCGFSMETDDLIANSRAKLERKSLDMICANSLRVEGAGFKGDTNVVTIITADDTIELGKLSKLDTAKRITDKALEMLKSAGK
ncbi:MAG: bifunctional phosphopantothenoylcysteine decarboxylase/phosphopantothenate--cysteine ligase CoaBC [Clostridiales bacterium]|nr:bifunctional phosphopantothenoylcysteine decarboxylase/phosphopantothenate--cysteine ligase CoaBC [Clostridiales bacterium]